MKKRVTTSSPQFWLRSRLANVLATLVFVPWLSVQPANGATDGAPTVYAAYVLLAPPPAGSDPVAFARVIVDAAQTECPQLLGGPTPIHMTFRSNPHGFEVKVCEASVPFEQPLSVSWNGAELPPVTRNPVHIVVAGDSGCKESDCAGDSVATPFDQLAAVAAALEPRPDLILHVGDYNYRGTKGKVIDKNTGQSLDVYDAGDNAPNDPQCQLTSPYVSQNAAYSESPDAWSNWLHDFFEPARPLFSTAPWIFTRGNHELCSRAGPGWFYFLDASAEPAVGGTSQLSCPSQGGDAPPTGDVFQYLQLTTPRIVNFENLRVAVMDSANACDGFAPLQTTSLYRDQLEQVLANVAKDKTTWLMTHRPIWGALQQKMSDAGAAYSAFPDYESINHTLQRGLVEALARKGEKALPEQLKLLVSGHMHTFEALTFQGDNRERRLPQLVVGNSGVALEGSATDGTFNARIDGAPAHLVGINEHGILDISRLDADGSWRGALLDSKARYLAQCSTRKLPDFICTRCDTSREIQALLDELGQTAKARKKLEKALLEANTACSAENFLAASRSLRRAVSLLLKAGRKGAATATAIDHVVGSIQSRVAATIREAVEKAGADDRHVEKAQWKFTQAGAHENPKKVITLLRKAYKQAARALSTL